MADYKATREWSDKRTPRKECTEAKADFRAGVKHLAEHHKEVKAEVMRDKMKGDKT